MERSKLGLPQHRQPTYEATLSRASSTSTLTNEKQQPNNAGAISEKHTSDMDTIIGEKKARPTAVVETMFQWVLKIMGVASAIVFGVWAPVSYRLQQNGNKSNDQAQMMLISRVIDLIERVDDMERALREIGKLKAMEVCSNHEHKATTICKSLAKEQDLEKIISDVVKGDRRTTRVPSQRRDMSTIKPTPSVSLATPTAQHDELFEEAPRATRSSAIEKPLTTSPPDLPSLPAVPKAQQTEYVPVVIGAVGLLLGVVMVCLCGYCVVRRVWQASENEKKEGVRMPLQSQNSPAYGATLSAITIT